MSRLLQLLCPPRALRWASLAAAWAVAGGCVEESPDAPGSWTFYPQDLFFETRVGTMTVGEFTIQNKGDRQITIDLSRPIGDGSCPEEPFLPVASDVTIAGNSAVTLRVEHAPTLLPLGGATCTYHIALTERIQEVPGDDDPPPADRRSLTLDGKVLDVDNDNDGYGRGSGDCNDRAIFETVDGLPEPREINPGVREKCNGVDDDCDGLIDDDDSNEDAKAVPGGAVSDEIAAEIADDLRNGRPVVVGQRQWYPDTDGDGFPFDKRAIAKCEQPFGYLPNDTNDPSIQDCNDQVFAIYPGAPEPVGSGVDYDCDDNYSCYVDADQDGYGNGVTRIPESSQNAYCTLVAGCQPGVPGNECVAPTPGDCNDAVAQISPSAAEVCDPLNAPAPIDEDCDNIYNDNDPTVAVSTQNVYYRDTDKDGFGNRLLFITTCVGPNDPFLRDPNDPNGPPRFVDDASDCNDGDAGDNPRGTEECDGVDNNCDGLIDDYDPLLNTANAPTWYEDLDQDGYGNPTISQRACGAPLSYVGNPFDCDDQLGTVNQLAIEVVGNGIDENCDGLESCFCDGDGDGWGDAGRTVTTSVFDCSSVNPVPPVGACTAASARPGDCRDDKPNNFPGNEEICDNEDNDCDNLVDGFDANATLNNDYYRDADDDGFGDRGDLVRGCAKPPGYVVAIDLNGNGVLDFDCDDRNDLAAPDLVEDDIVEVANEVDEDCDGRYLCFADADGDGFGDSASSTAVSSLGDERCTGPGVAPDTSDCNDGDSRVSPGAQESCVGPDPARPTAGVDEDCDGYVDDLDRDPLAQTAFYLDSDVDGFGTEGEPLFRCAAPAGYITTSRDCNDARVDVNPSAVELCDGADNDCDGATDDLDASLTLILPNGSPASFWWPDFDGDGYGDQAARQVQACAAPFGSVSRGLDCNDSDPDIRPQQFEVYGDQVDQNCDGLDDCFVDSDGDGYGSRVVQSGAVAAGRTCESAGFSSNGADCDDTPGIGVGRNPIAVEVCDGADNDCDFLVDDRDDDVAPQVVDPGVDAFTWWRDKDGDRFGNPNDVRFACSRPPGYVPEADDNNPLQFDCNDDSRQVNPTATEVVANFVDEDCNGRERCYVDRDRDGYGANAALAAPTDETDTLLDCRSVGWAPDQLDCDDVRGAVNPSQLEICNSVDDDCDGRVDDADSNRVTANVFYLDADGDGYGTPAVQVVRCVQPSGYSTLATDCNDLTQVVNPGAREVCDALNQDEDCNGAADDGDLGVNQATFNTYYVDQDGDGAGSTIQRRHCDRGQFEVDTSTDCNDSDGQVKPGAAEGVADGTDQNCDGRETCFCNKDGDDFGVSGQTVVVAIAGLAADACEPSGPPPGGPAGDCSTAQPARVSGDCNDFDAGTGQTESAWFLDADGDGYGSPFVVQVQCTSPGNNWVQNSNDCDDSSGLISPDGDEVCSDRFQDEDCDGAVDDDDPEGMTVASLRDVFPDDDFDGFGDESATPAAACHPRYDETLSSGDCDDNDASVKPGAPESVADDVDSDCNGQELCHCNNDGDSFGSEELVGTPYTGVGTCAPRALAPPYGTDCRSGRYSVAYVGGDCADRDPTLDTALRLFFYDNDGDGAGNVAVTRLSCTQPVAVAPAQWVQRGDDCNDANAVVKPTGLGGVEACDPPGVDEDCDGFIDDFDTVAGAVGKESYFDDLDGDDYGAGAGTLRCSAGPNQVRVGNDCNDANAAVHPFAVEAVADGVDQDCDGQERCYCDKDGDDVGIDTELVSVPVATACRDAAGPPAVPAASCSPARRAAVAGDCNDSDSSNTTSASVKFLDSDGDKRGDRNVSFYGCGTPAVTAPASWVTNPDDCNDDDPLVYGAGAVVDGGATPGTARVEVCNDIDDDCDGTADDGIFRPVWYLDDDGDGRGNPVVSRSACADPGAAWVSNPDDCNDANALVYGLGAATDAGPTPGTAARAETCNGIDDNCDSQIDESLARTLWFYDDDGDLRGDGGVFQLACADPGAAWVTNPDDCDDANNLAYGAGAAADGGATPGTARAEVCNAFDDDCDGVVDEGAAAPPLWFYDDDGDLRGDSAIFQLACADPGAAWVTNPDDCDDSNSAAYGPGAAADGGTTPGTARVEACNGFDDDCDGGIDESPGGPTLWFYDDDADLRGDPAVFQVSCADPGASWVSNLDDCDDGNVAIYGAGLLAEGGPTPGVAKVEVCDGVDQDCDGFLDNGVTNAYRRDNDLDGYTPSGAPIVNACAPPFGYATASVAPDCDDANAAIRPLATELCDGVDNNCAGGVDEATAADALACYTDADGDGYGDKNDNSATNACTCPANQAPGREDCVDSDADVNPGQAEVCNAIDDDCDGHLDLGADCGPTTTFVEVDDGANTNAYLIVSTAVPWPVAEAWCESYGYNFVRIEDGVDGPEALALDPIAAAIVGVEWWLGYTDGPCSSPDDWDYKSGGTCVDSLSTDEGQSLPNGNIATGRSAFHAVDNTGAGLWDDAAPNTLLPFICEEP